MSKTDPTPANSDEPQEPPSKGVSIRRLNLTIALPETDEPIELTGLSAIGIERITQLLETTEDPRILVQQVLEEQLYLLEVHTPIDQWSDTQLLYVINCFIEWALGDWEISETPLPVDSFDRAAEAIRALVDKQLSLARESAKSIQKIFAAATKNIVDFGSINVAHASLGSLDVSKLVPTFSRSLADSMQGTQRLIDGMREAYIAPTVGIANTLESFGTSLAATSAFQEQLNSALVSQVESLQRLVAPLPALTTFIEDALEYQRGVEALASEDWEFSLGYWSDAAIRRVGVEVAASAGTKTATDVVVDLTISDHFFTDLKDLVTGTPAISARWSLIQFGMEDHQNRRFAPAVALLLSQIEGLLNDLLVSQNLAVKNGSKLYRFDPATATQGGELGGLSPKANHSKSNTNIESDLATRIADTIAPDRNGILHGATLNFDTVDDSVGAVVVIAYLAEEISRLCP